MVASALCERFVLPTALFNLKTCAIKHFRQRKVLTVSEECVYILVVNGVNIYGVKFM